MDEKLIEMVSDYEELYDTSNKKYSDVLYKERIWSIIGEELNKTGNECKLRWASLRDQYRRYLRKNTTKRGQEGGSRAKYRYADEMAFVKPFLRERETVTNQQDDGASLGGTEDAEDMENDDVMAKKKQKMCSNDKDQKSVGENTSRQGSWCETKIPDQTPPQAATTMSEPPSNLLMKYLVASSKAGEKPNDATDLFFQSIAATVKTFSPYYQNVCKSKVFSVVSDLEMKQILGQSQPPTSTTPAPKQSTGAAEVQVKADPTR